MAQCRQPPVDLLADFNLTFEECQAGAYINQQAVGGANTDCGAELVSPLGQVGESRQFLVTVLVKTDDFLADAVGRVHVVAETDTCGKGCLVQVLHPASLQHNHGFCRRLWIQPATAQLQRQVWKIQAQPQRRRPAAGAVVGHGSTAAGGHGRANNGGVQQRPVPARGGPGCALAYRQNLVSPG